MEPIYKQHTHCRICNSTKLTKYLDLGNLPLANNLENTQKEALDSEKYPLEMLLCEDCGLSQLSIVVSPEKLYSHYTYRSGVSGGYIRHCQQMANDLEKYGINKNSLHIDIAGNDATLLKEFYKKYDHWIINVDPAENITRDSGVLSISAFWGIKIAEHINDIYGKADLITATNVFAHIDNLHDFISAAIIELKSNGILVIECPYVVDHIQKTEYTQIYHEHLSYMSVSPINSLCKELGMKIIDVSHQEIHGGSIRIVITHEDCKLLVEDSVSKYLNDEYNGKYLALNTYLQWSNVVQSQIENFYFKIDDLIENGHTVAAIAASAKGNTLLNSSGIHRYIVDYICDDTLEKQEKYSAGTGIPIVSFQKLAEDQPDYAIILAWNFKDALIKRARDVGFKGKFICPIPKFEII